jgi:hypothetical protein
MGIYKTPFKDAQGLDSVPHKGSSGGKYDSSDEILGDPGRDGGLLPELHRDTAVTSGSPSASGPVSTPYKDVVS